MRKKASSLLVALSLVCSCTPFCANADSYDSYSANDIITSYNEYYDDGSYSIVTIIEHPTGSLRSVKEGSKIYEHIVSGNTVWSYTIDASFSYNGSSSSCTSVSDSYTISNSNWHLNSRYHWKSGNTAYGSVTMDRKLLGFTVESVTRDLTLSCSANGTLS